MLGYKRHKRDTTITLMSINQLQSWYLTQMLCIKTSRNNYDKDKKVKKKINIFLCVFF